MFSNRLAEVMSLVEEVAFRRMDQRVARRLQELFGRGHGSHHAIEVTHADLAADLGTAREVVSRLLKEFERLGAISLSRGKIQVIDARMLRELASGGAE
jgi:CRP/FNR family transcriptional regulator